MAFCRNCGTQVQEGWTHCPTCGAPVGAQPQQSTPVAAVQKAVRQKDFTAEFDPADISQNKVVAMAPYVLGVLGVIVALLAARDSKYAAFHARQALKLEVVSAILGVAAILLIWTIVTPIAAAVCEVILFVVRIICFVQVCMGQAKEAPILGALPFLR